MSSGPTEFQQTLHDDLSWCLARSRAQVVRPISQWVEEELVLPSGPFRGERFRHRRHPVSQLWFHAVGAGDWNRFAASGPTQNGKTLMCYVAPIMYHLFELQETVIIGIPTMQMAQDKWVEDLLPAIEASRYATLLPTSGEGSRGGQVKRAIRFRNEVSLRFMAAGGGDKQRAGYTSRILAITETDGMDEAGEKSREADAIEQLEGRTRAYGGDKRVYLECTASIEKGRIWQEIVNGTDSRIYRPCPYCGSYVSPEREHLRGWQESDSELEAAEKAHWVCPDCQVSWTDEDRRNAAGSAVLAHRGQKVLNSGDGVGEPPRTKTLGFRWSAIDNPFASAAALGAEEWKSQRSHDDENAEKKMRQFVWCLPWDPPDVELNRLAASDVVKRVGELDKGVLPTDSIGVAVGIDTGKRMLHWHALAICANGSAHVLEYGEQPTDADTVGMTRGLREALTEISDYFDAVWQPSQVWIDSGYPEHQEGVYQFCRQKLGLLDMSHAVYRPSKGFAEGQRRTTRYISPHKRTAEVRYLGKQYHMTYQQPHKLLLVNVNADFWKGELHQRLAMNIDEPGSITIYRSSNRTEHMEYSRQLTAERQIEQWMEHRGNVVVWERIRRSNHYLDAAYLSLAAADFIQFNVSKTPKTLAELAAGSGSHHGR